MAKKDASHDEALDQANAADPVLPSPPNDLIVLQQGFARPVTNADDETFLLYSLSRPEDDRAGLGFVNASSDTLRVTVALRHADGHPEIAVESIDEEEQMQIMSARYKSRSRGKGGASSARSRKARTSSKDQTPSLAEVGQVVVAIRQNTTSLRSTVGDTGSVVWRSSLSLASLMLRQLLSPSCETSASAPPLLQSHSFQIARILELGAGTGVLPLLLLAHPDIAAPNVGTTWIATDQAAMMPLLRRNLDAHHLSQTKEANASTSCNQSSGVRLGSAELDWLEAQQAWESGVESRRQRFRSAVLSDFVGRSTCHVDKEAQAVEDDAWPDLILASDCIYNPSLFAALLATIDLFCAPNRTLALIVCELRSAETVQLWLSNWLARGSSEDRGPNTNGKWCICSLEKEMLGHMMGKGNAAWVAWRTR
ncbi:Cytosine deaminase FCY1 and related enzymes [Ceraceosorus bombacis]|uniref:Cytosine deaminase FCY1 and related enzymes n=1 Tax=Ceraceosorus bombacis TaxID=401625 RepID=A0A0P1BQ70_9BASI|nr:Cytosine deaminase FCY1 and related enzymes [Ceraceosorus bombacis]